MTDHTPEVPQKQCPWCDKLLPATNEFWATDRSREDGLCYACKACQYKRRRELKATAAERKARKESGLKICPRCERELPATLDYFYQEKRRKSFCLKSYCKECDGRIAKETKDKDRERETAYQYYLTHKEQAHDRHRRWRLRNLEREREKERTYQQDQRDRKRMLEMWMPKPSRKKKDPFRKRKKNRSKTILQRYKARKLGLPNDFTEQDWQFALDYFGGCCAVCGRPAGLFHTLAMDHFYPLSKPSCLGTVPNNILPLCHGQGGCNNEKHNKDPETWLIAKLGKHKSIEALARIREFFSKVRQV